MKKRTYVELNGKTYTVSYDWEGNPQIWTRWDIINPRTVWNIHPEYFTRFMSISPHGRLGKKIMKLVAQKEAT